MSAENTTNTGAQEAENAEKYAVEVKNVTKIYRLYDKPIDRLKESLSVSHKEYHKDFYALSDLSFTVEKGQTVGIIGTNGSGKSTILKIITSLASSKIAKKVIISDARKDSQTPFSPNRRASVTAQGMIATAPRSREPAMAGFGCATAEK